MQHLPDLIQDLGFILMTAAVVSVLFKKLKQPVVLGYLIAGFLLSPNFLHYPSIRDLKSITIWAEIGVIFMLFGLGLEFSFKKLKKVGKSASITASFEIFFMLGLGYLTGQFLGWSSMDSLFLGGILSISSTTIIVRAFEELGLKGRNFVSLVFGVLIVEDLIAILLLVILSSVAVTQTLSGADLALSSIKLIFFLILWFLLGIYLLPIFLNKFRAHLSNETTLIVSLGLCLMMVIVANQTGFSPALGAFVMGSILAETREGRRIEHLIVPVKDLFSAVFFVSVGMLIDAQILWNYGDVILLIVGVTIVGKLLSTTLGALVSGRSLRTSVQAGMSLAQIGEFSFIIATLGLTLKVTSDFLYPIAVAVSALTTFATPHLIQYADTFYHTIESRIPNKVKLALSRYEAAMATNSDVNNPLSLLWEEYGIKIGLNSVVVIAVTLAMKRLAMPFVTEQFGSHSTIDFMMCAVTLLLTGPFLWAIFFGGPTHSEAYKESTVVRLDRLQLGVTIVRNMIGFLLTSVVVGHFISIWAFSGGLVLAFTVLAGFLFSRFSEPLYQKIEARFIANLTQNEREALKKKTRVPDLAPWSATLAEFHVSGYSPLIGKTLLEAGLKESFGVTVALIERGGRRILAPTRNDLIMPLDRFFVIGTDEQLAAIRPLMEPETAKVTSDSLLPMGDSFGLTSLTLLPSDPFVDKSIRECGLREAVNGLIVGLERTGTRYLSPDSAMVLKSDDLVWIVGDRLLINALRDSEV